MYKNLKVKNYKSLKEIVINMNEISILTGSNSAGKSSVIQSLLLLDKALKNNEEKIFTNNLFGTNFGLPSKLINTEADNMEIIFELDNKNVSLGLQNPKFEENYFDCKVKYNDEKDFNVFYINSERIGPRLVSNINSSDANYVGPRGENTIYSLTRLDRESIKVPETLKIDKQNKFSLICQDWINTIIPDVKFNLKQYDDLGISAIRFGNSTENFSPNNVGFGITYILPIIVQALYLSTLDEKNKSNIMLIIENPEAHLHPFSQSRMGKFLAKLTEVGVQVIIETHSEHIINGARLYLAERKNTEKMSVYFLMKNENENTKVEEIKIDEYGELTHWPEGFFDQSIIDLKKLLKIRLG